MTVSKILDNRQYSWADLTLYLWHSCVFYISMVTTQNSLIRSRGMTHHLHAPTDILLRLQNAHLCHQWHMLRAGL